MVANVVPMQFLGCMPDERNLRYNHQTGHVLNETVSLAIEVIDSFLSHLWLIR